MLEKPSKIRPLPTQVLPFVPGSDIISKMNSTQDTGAFASAKVGAKLKK